ncbi:uncharacterized protein FOMMEDRAFT_17751 [Fomitiporia mediterranea MF3/22]|uniref:uncharacterized protein n=1 Tax=Fomitiporia mediterranea (strain MF3/22) TaxID=694068 RepID=UPI000440750E|nr:uncharacterized protein FOMMEDRAFT_17751 [Fomitiporia mediterranea MF3/22]EJD05456.1 hypothetical protein FOMMEDRAFT_17751 [Fomitiporia mediterranea MF3/22]
MSAPLPRRLPVDEDEHDDVEEDVPSKIQMLTKATSVNDLTKENSKGSVSLVVRLPDPDNSKEDGEGSPDEDQLSPVKGREPASSHLPDPEESCEIGADRKAARLAPRKRVSSNLPDPEESVEVGVNPPQGLSKTAYREPCLPDPEESCEVGAYHPDGLVPQRAGRGRTSLKTCLPDADETFDSNASAPRRVLRKRGLSESRDSDADERQNVTANHNEVPRKRVTRVARLPDPDESREIGDERPAARPSRRAKVASRATLRDLAAADDEESEAEV